VTSSESHARMRSLKSSAKLALVLAAIFGVLSAAASSVYAQVWERLEPVNDYYLIEAQYDKTQAFSGSPNLYFKVVLKTPENKPVPADQVLKLVTEYELLRDSGIRLISENSDGNPELNTKDGYKEEIYTFQIEIPENTPPRSHKLKLKFRYLNRDKTSVVTRPFDLNVGLLSKGKLKVTVTGEPLTAGHDGLYVLRLQNEYPDYAINIHKVTVSSTPAGLINKIDLVDVGDAKAQVNGNTVFFTTPLTIGKYQQATIQLRIKARDMSAGNWLFGFDEGSTLGFGFEYDDSNLRTISDYSADVPVKIGPGDWKLLGAMLVGVLIGTGLKFYLEYLRRTGVIRRKEVGVFVTITMVVGIVIAIIAWAGQIQIIAFKDINFSYDRPVVIFVIGLVGALAGVHYLNNWAKKLLPHESGGGKEAGSG
jgi:hypothetical protein